MRFLKYPLLLTVSEDYKPPFKFTVEIEKVAIDIEE